MAEIIYRVAKRDGYDNLNHPLIDSIILGVRWADLEPMRGKFTTTELLATIHTWQSAGKNVYVKFIAYGNAEDGLITPEWVYNLLPRISAEAGLGSVSIPYLLAPRYRRALFPAIVNTLRSLGADGYLISCGHNGSLAATPDRKLGNALIAAGWRNNEWIFHCRRVIDELLPLVNLFSTAAFTMLRDGTDNYLPTMEQAVDLVADYSLVITLGLESRNEDMPLTVARVNRLKNGRYPIALGDDWPLWVPIERRDQKPTLNRDDADFAQSLVRARELDATKLLIQSPEADASRPDHSGFVPAVHEALDQFRSS